MIRAALCLCLASGPALGGAACDLRQNVLNTLAAKYGETRRSIGIAQDNTIMEVFASEVTGSWTLTVTLPTGMTCLVAAGQNYEAVTEALPPQGTDG